jgi:restriction endonuclease Mrr
MLPLLRVHADGEPHSRRELRQRLAAVLSLSEGDLGERLPSGVQGTFENRTNYCTTGLRRSPLGGSRVCPVYCEPRAVETAPCCNDSRQTRGDHRARNQRTMADSGELQTISEQPRSHRTARRP